MFLLCMVYSVLSTDIRSSTVNENRQQIIRHPNLDAKKKQEDTHSL
jgi:hypothetical protein